jgi:hypothetical protein
MKKTEIEVIEINGEKFIKESDVLKYNKAEKKNDMPYCIVRTYSAGVFAGYVESRIGKEVTIRDVRRIWYWEGANSLSQLAVDGTSKPSECKFAVLVDKIEVTEAIEIIECTSKAQQSIVSVPEWKK